MGKNKKAKNKGSEVPQTQAEKNLEAVEDHLIEQVEAKTEEIQKPIAQPAPEEVKVEEPV